MEEILKEFVTKVQEINGTKTVTYCHPTYSHFSGVCIYNKVTTKGLRKPIAQYFLVLTRADIFISFFSNDFQWNGGIEVHHPCVECQPKD